jgi:teichuronic acid biosynthesis glycosyltransferase TuaC
MKILHITNNYPTKNLPIFGIFVKEQIDSLAQTNVLSEVFFVNGKERGKLEYVRSIVRLNKLLSKNNFDIIHCHHAFSAIVFLFSGFSGKIPSVVSFQNDPSDESLFNLFNIIKHFSTTWIFKNRSIFADNKRGHYLPNGVNIDFFRPIDKREACLKIGVNPDKKYILFVSSNYVRKQKRYDKFQHIVSELKKWDGSIEELTLINTQRHLVPYYFNAAALHLLTSDFEGSPNSVKEALSCNIPVVATQVGNVKELLEEVNGSYCTNSFSETELIALCKKSLTEVFVPNSRNKLIEKGYDINNVAIELRKIYLKIIESKQNGRYKSMAFDTSEI